MLPNLDLSIITVNWNTHRLLLQFIESIVRTIGDIPYELIVVDNCSSDGSAQLVESNFPNVRVLSLKDNLGFSRAANLALKSTSGDYILVAHPDTCFQENAISILLSRLKSDTPLGVVGGNLVYPNGTWKK